VHKESVTIAVQPSDAAVPTKVDKLAYDIRKRCRYLERLGPAASLWACDEASGAGYVLQRELASWRIVWTSRPRTSRARNQELCPLDRVTGIKSSVPLILVPLILRNQVLRNQELCPLDRVTGIKSSVPLILRNQVLRNQELCPLDPLSP
jgi:hypothetical protein